MIEHVWQVMVKGVCVGYANITDDPDLRFKLIKEAVNTGLIPGDHTPVDIEYKIISREVNSQNVVITTVCTKPLKPLNNAQTQGLLTIGFGEYVFRQRLERIVR